MGMWAKRAFPRLCVAKRGKRSVRLQADRPHIHGQYGDVWTSFPVKATKTATRAMIGLLGAAGLARIPPESLFTIFPPRDSRPIVLCRCCSVVLLGVNLSTGHKSRKAIQINSIYSKILGFCGGSSLKNQTLAFVIMKDSEGDSGEVFGERLGGTVKGLGL